MSASTNRKTPAWRTWPASANALRSARGLVDFCWTDATARAQATFGESVQAAASTTARSTDTIGSRRIREMSDDGKRRLRRHSTPNMGIGFELAGTTTSALIAENPLRP